MTQQSTIIQQAIEVLEMEAEGILKLVDRIDDNFVRAVDVIYRAGGRVIVGGIATNDGYIALTLALGIYTASHIAEIIRGSILAVPKGQVEAANALALSGFILASAFDDLDWGEVADAARSLNDAELLSLGSMWILWVTSQGLLTASLVPGLPVRRGVVAYLGPAAITSAVPGPSDLPVRYAMLISWGRTAGEASLAVAAGGIFSIGVKLVLPVVAAVGLVVTGLILLRRRRRSSR